MARWTGKRTLFWGVRVREGERAGPMGIPFDNAFGVSTPGARSSSERSSSARSKTSAKMPLSRVHLTSWALLLSTSILCLSTLSRYQSSICPRPLATSSWCRCRAIRLSLPANIPSHSDSISSCLLTLSMPLKTSSSVTRLFGDRPRSEGTSPR